MLSSWQRKARDRRELRLFLEELCCYLIQLEHVEQDGLLSEEVRISREVDLGTPQSFADITVKLPTSPPYFVEVKYGYESEMIVSHLSRKYGAVSSAVSDASKVVLVAETQGYENWAETQRQIEASLRPGLILEVWDEDRLLSVIEDRLGLRLNSLKGSDILEVKVALDRAGGELAFGKEEVLDELHTQLLWHFGPWRLRKLVESHNSDASLILPPRHYDNVVILMADLSSYTNYVRDTKHQEVIRHALTSFCTKARHEILNTGGMLYQFIGDEVVGLYGIPDYRSGYPREALEAATSLIDVGKSVSNHWQSQLDRIQSAKGVHIGMAIGDLHVVSNRPFGRAHFSIVGDAVNVAARLRQHAKSGEIVVSNSYFRALDHDPRWKFEKLEPIEARNLGSIQAWKLQA